MSTKIFRKCYEDFQVIFKPLGYFPALFKYEKKTKRLEKASLKVSYFDILWSK
jgi:hypothetical protein